jgi:hypothetical protein
MLRFLKRLFEGFPTTKVCDCCGGTARRRLEECELYPGATGRMAVTFKQPVWKCDSCKEEFTDWEAELIREEVWNKTFRKAMKGFHATR